MALVAERKTELIKEYQLAPKDTGSVEVQVALLTERINYLTEHMKMFKKDVHTRHGLLLLVSKRRRLLKYLKRVDDQRYRQLIERLNLRS